MLHAFKARYGDYFAPRKWHLEGVTRNRLLAAEPEVARTTLRKPERRFQDPYLPPIRSTSGWVAEALGRVEDRTNNRGIDVRKSSSFPRTQGNPYDVEEHASVAPPSSISAESHNLPPSYDEASAKIREARLAEQWAEALTRAGYTITRIEPASTNASQPEATITIPLFEGGGVMTVPADWNALNEAERYAYWSRTDPMRILVGHKFKEQLKDILTMDVAERLVADRHDLVSLLRIVQEHRLVDEVAPYGETSALTILRLYTVIRRAAEFYRIAY